MPNFVLYTKKTSHPKKKMSIIQNNSTRKTRKSEAAVLPGKYPPQALELEEAVLGAMMLEKQKLADVIEIITSPECFYLEANQKVYAAIQSLFNKGGAVDMLTVTEELRLSGDLDLVGGAYYITKLTYAVVSSANIEQHARIVVQKYIQRELIRMSSDIISTAYEETTDVFELLDEAEQNLYEISDKYLRKNFSDITSILNGTIKEIEVQSKNKDEFTGVPTGYPVLDKITGGWQKTDLIVLAARPSVGKTAFALNLLLNAAMHKHRPASVAFFSLEMSTRSLVKRMLSNHANLSMGKVTRGQMADYEMEALKERSESLKEASMYLDDQGALSIMELRAKSRRIKQKYGLDMIVIDYLQLMTHGNLNKNSNRENEVSKISRDLKSLAKELEVPIIALSQLNRSLESRKDGNKIPQLSDLRESGAIEQDADMVMFLYRPEYHDITESPDGEAAEKGLTLLKIAKHRNGALEDLYFKAQLEYQRFMEIGTEDDYEKRKMGGDFMNTQIQAPSDFDPSTQFGSIENTENNLKIDNSISLSSKMNTDDFLDNTEKDDDITGDNTDEDAPF